MKTTNKCHMGKIKKSLLKRRISKARKLRAKYPWYSNEDIGLLVKLHYQTIRVYLKDMQYIFFVKCNCGKPIQIVRCKAKKIKMGKLYTCTKCKGFLHGVRAIRVKTKKENENEQEQEKE